ncbi:glycine betaine ABC transporter substrate-binding protein [Legionella israelensis]|nr:glycine betaine ABC transporter substrate-binding protein [Legionella israelensis]
MSSSLTSDTLKILLLKPLLMKKIAILFICLFLFSTITHSCDLDRTIRFAGNDWDSNSFSTEVARYILETGYGCKTESIRGTSVPLLNALVRGDVDINMELWKANNIQIWNKMLKTGRVSETKGVSIDRATQNFYIPRFIVYGDPKQNIKPLAPKLRSVVDMKKYHQLFSDPADPNKGRFYNCKIGWDCETMNSKKLAAYGLLDYYNNFRTGSGEALRSEIISALQRRKPLFFYYWRPTYLMGKYGNQMLELKEPPYNTKDWNRLVNSKTGKGLKGVAYPSLTIHIAANVKFLDKAPNIAKFLNLFYMSTEFVNEGLVYMNDHQDLRGRKAAIAFLKNNPEIWQSWIPEANAKRVHEALSADHSLDKQKTASFLLKLSGISAIIILTALAYLIGQRRWSKHRLIVFILPIITLITLVSLYILYSRPLFYNATPAHSFIPFRSFIDEFVNELVIHYADFLRHSISYPILYIVGVFERFLVNQLSWLFLTALFTALAFHASRKIGLTLFVLIGNLIIWGMQLWVPGVQTLILIFIAIILTASLGLPLGILAGLNQTIYRTLSPILDVMQTMPSFVYLIPVVMLFGLGTFSGVVATAMYAMPPLIRLTALGIRQVDRETLEAAKAFGTHRKQILTKVQLPLALPSIMVGINQAIMMALAMVVIASMIGVKGLGQQVLFGLQQQDMGVGFTAGLAIVFLSIMLDRISQAYGHRLQVHYHMQGSE